MLRQFVAYLFMLTGVFAEPMPIDLEPLQFGPDVRRNGDVLRIELPSAGEAKVVRLFELENPQITQDSYALTGEVRYENVAGVSYLEMWNHLPGKAGESTITQSFFSRTLESSGPLGQLSGDSDWRDFRLPALVNDGSKRRPLKLSINLHLAQGGTVEIRDLRLIDGLGVIPGVSTQSRLFSLIFVAGMVCAAGALVGWLGFLRRQRQNELRRIQAADL